jgi:gamma-glutamyl:cysteine ligase YbdK (ATP-grasp superfamily)
MSLAIVRDTFADEEYARFTERCVAQLDALGRVVADPTFGEGPPSIGAELELPLITADGGPAPVNRALIAAVNDPRLTVEIARYNLELNLTPVPAAGRPFAALEAEIVELMGKLARHGASLGATPLPVGILPSITRADTTRDAMTDLPRYRALEAAVRRVRRGPARLVVRGREALEVEDDGVMLEGANTSFQVHLRVPAGRFADTYNAAQLATPVALAVAGNSPVFLGRALWDETRIVVFKQSVDMRAVDELAWHRPSRVAFGHGWVRHGIHELFAESVRLHPPIFPVSGEGPAVDAGFPPALPELRLHQGTVWRWNRAIYDPSAEGHLRIEYRALPSGPTPRDMMANAAFLLGLTVGLRDDIEARLCGCPFLMCDTSFYRAARDGLDATLLWPTKAGPAPRERRVVELTEKLLPVAAEGLSALGVHRDEAADLLQVIESRLATGRTGARWQRAALEHLRSRVPDAEVLPTLVREYAARAATQAPVHTWGPL